MAKRSFNFLLVIKLFGFLLFLESFAMLISGVISFLYNGNDVFAFTISTIITFTSGLLLYFIGKKADRVNIGKREGYFFVTLVWVLFSAFGMLPFLIGGYIPDVASAFFETMSGFSTTGASVITDIEVMPHGILFWRSITHWLGGMGIIMLSLAIMPLLNMGNVHLFAAEVPGLTVDKLQPRIISTARILWFIYLMLTLVQTLLLYFAGMSLFDAVCHSFSTMATGGFSTKNSSIAYWDSAAIEYIIIFFMFISGINFPLLFWALTGKFKKLKHNDEFNGYVLIILICSILLGFGFWLTQNMEAEDSIRNALFNVISFLTTTGYVLTTDYKSWEPILTSILMFTMLIGGMAGSTSGGIKVGRIIVMIRHALNEMKKILHPNAVFPVHYNNKSLSTSVTHSVLGYIVLYVTLVFVGVGLLLSEGKSLDDSIVAVITSISNVGSGMGEFSHNFSSMSDLGKWTCSFLMLTGRLEIYTVLILLMPSFWKR